MSEIQISETMKEKLERGRQYRSALKFTAETRENDGEKQMIVEGHACTFDEPYLLYSDDMFEVREQVAAGAFDNCDMSDVIMQYNHEGRVYARNRNNTLTVNVDAKGLFVRANLEGTELGKQIYQEISEGYTDRMSFGFHVAESEYTYDEQPGENGKYQVLRTIKAIDKLYDVSCVSIPANDATDISARSAADGAIEAVKMELSEKRAKEKAKSKLTAECEALLSL